MALGDLDFTLKPPLPELWLAKADKTIIAKLTNRSGIGFSRYGKRTKFLRHTQLYKLNGVSEMEFSIPFQVEINHELVRNTVVDQIVESCLIKSIHNSIEEWFCITDLKKTMDGSQDLLTVSCRSLGYELMRRYVRNFNVVSQTLSSICLGGTTVDKNGNTVSFSGLLQSTLWTLASDTDATFDTVYRSFNISKATVLDAIMQAAKSFNAIVVFDTVNRKIKFMQLQNIGQDKGGRITYENYMKALENESKTDLLVTRFVPYGKNGLTINAITGYSYIDDFSFWTAGFTRDVSKNVLTSSPHMSDSLAGAILDYIALQQTHSGEFSTYINNLSTYQSQLTTKKNELASLNTTLVTIQNSLDIAQTTGQPTASWLTQQSNQKSLIATKQTEIDTVNANITSTNNSIATLQTTMSTNNNFTNAQQQELIPFVREAEWTDNNISSAQELYNQALIQFQKYKTPQILLKVDMVNVFEQITEQRIWSKFGLGDTITVEYDVLGTNVKSKIIEISFNHAEGNVQITVASVADLLRQEEQVYNMLYQSISAANTLSVNLDSWNGIDKVAKDVNAIYNNGIDAAKMAISSAVNNSVVTNNRGITITDSSNANKFIRMTNGVIGLSADGGNTFSTAIDATGVYAPRLTGQILIGANLGITNQAGTVTIDGNGMNITNMDLTLTRSDVKSRIKLNPTDGIKIQKNTGTTGVPVWSDQISLDGSGNAIFGGTISIGSGSSVFKADTNGIYLGSSTFSSAPFRVDLNGVITASNVNLTGGQAGWGNFSISPSGVITATGANISGNVTASSVVANISITSPSISGGVITGTTVQTRTPGSYPRVAINSSGDLIEAYLASDKYILINSTTSAGYPRMDLQYGANGGNISFYSGQLQIFSDLDMGINSNNNVFIAAVNELRLVGFNINLKSTGGTVKINTETVATQPWVQANAIAKFA